MAEKTVRITEVYAGSGGWFEDPDGDLEYHLTIDVPLADWNEFRDTERRLRELRSEFVRRRQQKREPIPPPSSEETRDRNG